MSDNNDLEKRLAALEESKGEAPKSGRPSSLLAFGGVAAILAVGTAIYLALPQDEEASLPTAEPAEFQNEGDGLAAIEPFAQEAEPEPEPEPQPDPNAELRSQLAAMQQELERLRNAEEPAEDNSAATEALNALTDQVAALQKANEDAQAKYEKDLQERDRELQRLRSDLELAQLSSINEPMAASGPTEEELRMAELERRRAEEAEFQKARINSGMIAFGGGASGGGGEKSDLAERSLEAATDFVLNGAQAAEVTQAEVIANPSNTVPQGTMIQAVTETVLDSSLPGGIRAIVSEDVHSYDGSRILIPRGSRLIGRYRSGVEIAEKRVTVAWDRIILPTQQTVNISSFGGDELGRSGVTGKVNNRFGTRFGSAALISIIGAVPTVAASEIDSEAAADTAEDVGDDLQSATDNVMSDYLSLGPVIYVDQGERITVMVDRDLEIF